MTIADAPFTQWMMTPGDMQKHWQEFLERMSHMPKVLEVARKTRVGATPTETVKQLDKVRLLRYLGDREQEFETPLIVVFALVNRPYILDLRKGKSVVSHFLSRGFNTYNVDWGVPSDGDRFLGMKDYIEGYMDEVVDHVCEECNVDQVNILGYCMGGSMSAMYTALHQDKVKNLILMAAPVDWSSRDHLLGQWTDKKVFDVDKLIEVYGNMPAEMLQNSFQMLKPVSSFVEKYFTFYENMHDEKFLEDFFAMETWLQDNVPVAGEMFREFVKHCMQENQLIQGKLRVGGRTVNLADITCPLLNLTAEQDHLVPCGLSHPLNDAVSSADRSTINFRAGHIGLAVGSRANKELWPNVANWLAERSSPIGV